MELEKVSSRIIGSAVVAVALFFLCLCPPLASIIRNSLGRLNLIAYCLCAFAYVLLLLILRNSNISFSASIWYAIEYLLLLFLLLSFALETHVFASVPAVERKTVLYALLYCLLLLLITIYCCKNWNRSFHRKNMLYWVLTTVLICICFYNQYKINYLRAVGAEESYSGSSWHLNAYINSIINLFWGQPFTDTNTSIYGHYAFFYVPIFRLMWTFGIRNLIKSEMLISASLIAGTILIWSVILFNIVKHPYIRMLGLLGVGYINTSRVSNVSIYQQIFPHRSVVICGIALIGMLWWKRKEKTLISILGYIYCCFALIWSTDMGIIVLLSWSVFNCCAKILGKKRRFTVFYVAIHLFLVPLVFISAVWICGLLNVTSGGNFLSIRSFLFPLLNPHYMVDVLEAELSLFPSAWMSITFLMLVFLGVGLTNSTLFWPAVKEKNDKYLWMVFMGILGLGSLSYAINRPAYGCFYLIMPQAAVMISVLAELQQEYAGNKYRNAECKPSIEMCTSEKWPTIYQGYKAFLREKGICVFVLLAVATSSIINTPYKISLEREYKNEDVVRQVIREMEAIDDGRAYAVGFESVNAFSYMGRDPKIYFMDFPDIRNNQQAVEEIKPMLKQLEEKAVFISSDVDKYLEESFYNYHLLEKEIPINARYVIRYYVPTSKDFE